MLEGFIELEKKDLPVVNIKSNVGSKVRSSAWGSELYYVAFIPCPGRGVMS